MNLNRKHISIFKIVSFIILIQTFSGCKFYNKCISKYYREDIVDARNARKVKNYSGNLYFVNFSINGRHNQEFNEINFDTLCQNLPLEEIKNYLMTNYKVILNYEIFIEALNNGNYKIEYDKNHGAAGDVYDYKIIVNNSEIENRIGIDILINWQDKYYLFCHYIDIRKSILQKVYDKQLKSCNSEDIYSCIIQPFKY